MHVSQIDSKLGGVPSGPVIDNPATLMLLEDDAALAYAVQRTLQLDGHQVHHAADSEQGLEILHGLLKLDLLIADFRVPGRLDGVEMVRTARALRWPRLKVLFISGDIDDVATMTKRVDNIRLLGKPFHMGDLRRTVDHFLASPAVE